MTISHGADEDRISAMESELAEIRVQLDAILETLVKADTTITKVADEVKPTLDALLKSPLIKMLMPKGK